jgi:hypothetical protein
MKVGKFERLGKLAGLKDWEGGRILSPVINVFLQLHVHCVSYHSGDYRTERLVHSIAVLHVVQIHINISIYYSVVQRLRILDKSLPGTRTQLPCISSDRDDQNWDDREVGKFGRLCRPENLRG